MYATVVRIGFAFCFAGYLAGKIDFASLAPWLAVVFLLAEATIISDQLAEALAIWLENRGQPDAAQDAQVQEDDRFLIDPEHP